jgi:hypothetical protein
MNIMQGIMLNGSYAQCHIQALYAQCHVQAFYAEGHYAESHYQLPLHPMNRSDVMFVICY